MNMRCDTCKQESPVVMRVLIAAGYNRAMARPIYNCPACYEKKEAEKPYLKPNADAASTQGDSKT